LEVNRLGPAGCESGYFRLDEPAKLELLEETAAWGIEHRGQHRHRGSLRPAGESAVTDATFNQSHGLQYRKRLPHGHTADSELLCQLPLGHQAVPRPELSIRDQGLQLADDLLVGTCLADRQDPHDFGVVPRSSSLVLGTGPPAGPHVDKCLRTRKSSEG